MAVARPVAAGTAAPGVAVLGCCLGAFPALGCWNVFGTKAVAVPPVRCNKHVPSGIAALAPLNKIRTLAVPSLWSRTTRMGYQYIGNLRPSTAVNVQLTPTSCFYLFGVKGRFIVKLWRPWNDLYWHPIKVQLHRLVKKQAAVVNATVEGVPFRALTRIGGGSTWPDAISSPRVCMHRPSVNVS